MMMPLAHPTPRRIALALSAALGLSTSLALAQPAPPAPLPKELSGRWSLASPAVSQTFSLRDIAPSGEGAFTARLSWYTTDPNCAVQNERITGRVTASGIAFDAATRCNDRFTAELDRGESGWRGKAVRTSGTPIEVSLTAR